MCILMPETLSICFITLNSVKETQGSCKYMQKKQTKNTKCTPKKFCAIAVKRLASLSDLSHTSWLCKQLHM